MACSTPTKIAVEERATPDYRAPVVTGGQVSDVLAQSQVPQASNQRVRTSQTRQAKKTHTVSRGETLYSIAFQYGMSVSDLIRINQIQDVTQLAVGRQLFLVGSSNSVSSKKPSVSQPAASSSQPVKQNSVAKASGPLSGPLKWQWPIKGRLLANFANSGTKGIVIAGKQGESVFPTTAGQVVYTGSALKGYGKLIIINHADGYLSAYAHTAEILVREGQNVVASDVIAKVGKDEQNRTALHFQMRRDGNVFDPLKLLPR
ncbi:MAG: peptidoglycan DD-metalloendopeptidase family protein [Pseudomonadota bacterium]